MRVVLLNPVNPGVDVKTQLCVSFMTGASVIRETTFS